LGPSGCSGVTEDVLGFVDDGPFVSGAGVSVGVFFSSSGVCVDEVASFDWGDLDVSFFAGDFFFPPFAGFGAISINQKKTKKVTCKLR
jgi:hypothetical protein